MIGATYFGLGQTGSATILSTTPIYWPKPGFERKVQVAGLSATDFTATLQAFKDGGGSTGFDSPGVSPAAVVSLLRSIGAYDFDFSALPAAPTTSTQTQAQTSTTPTPTSSAPAETPAVTPEAAAAVNTPAADSWSTTAKNAVSDWLQQESLVSGFKNLYVLAGGAAAVLGVLSLSGGKRRRR